MVFHCSPYAIDWGKVICLWFIVLFHIMIDFLVVGFENFFPFLFLAFLDIWCTYYYWQNYCIHSIWDHIILLNFTYISVNNRENFYTYTYMYLIVINWEKVINLKESTKRHMGGPRGRKGKRKWFDYIIYPKQKKNKYNDDHSREFKLCLSSKTHTVI